jgi:hypothetical protein
LALLLHIKKFPFQVGKAAVLTKVFVGFPQIPLASARIARSHYTRTDSFHVVPVDA